MGQTEKSFHDAPYSNNRVTITFVFIADDVHKQYSERVKSKNADTLAKMIRHKLSSKGASGCGYECQERNGAWMLAFQQTVDAVEFGITLINDLKKAPISVKIGIQSGYFTSMNPHAVTGRADYFGPVVNRAARVASWSEPGQVNVGVEVRPGEEKIPLNFGSKIDVQFLDTIKLKGLSVEMAIYSCHAGKSNGVKAT